MLWNKKGMAGAGGNVIGLITFMGTLVITTIIVLIFISQLNGANLLTTNSAEANVTNQMAGNVTSGIAEINTKIPTFFKVVAIVFLLGILALLWFWFGGRGKGSPM